MATYIVGQQVDYHFTVKGNQPNLERDIASLFENRQAPDFVEVTPPDHGRTETRRIWCGPALNAYIDFPHVGQVFLIERETLTKKTGEIRREAAQGMTSRTSQATSPQQVLAINRGHWSIESVHHIIDWNYDEDRSRIRTGFGPENITRLRRFAVGILNSLQKPARSIAELVCTLSFGTHLVFDYLLMTKNSTSSVARPQNKIALGAAITVSGRTFLARESSPQSGPGGVEGPGFKCLLPACDAGIIASRTYRAGRRREPRSLSRRTRRRPLGIHASSRFPP